MQRDEAIGKELLGIEFAWPMGQRLRARQRFSTERLHLLDKLDRKDSFCVFQAHPFVFDRLSDLVEKRTSFEETYAVELKVMSDHRIPPDVLEAYKNPMPQFILRNIGRAERYVDPDAPLPVERKEGVKGNADDLFEQVRSAEIPAVRMAEIWSVAFNTEVRQSFRRLLMEDPWELRFGAEVRINHAGPQHEYIVAGTHPDDLKGANWGPELIAVPETWAEPPRGTAREDRATTMQDVIDAMRRNSA